MRTKLHSNCFVLFTSIFLPFFLRAQSDIAVNKTATTTISPNRNLTYTIQVVNYGPGSATNVNLTDNLPTATTFVSFTAPAGWNAITPVVGVNAPVLATIPVLPPGAMQTFTLVVNVGSSVPPGTGLSNTLTISSSTPDPNQTNNFSGAFTSVAVVPPFDLAVIKRGFPTLNAGGGNLFYTIQVVNIGLEPQTSVSLADILPSGTTFVSLSAPVGWTVTTPPVGSNGIITASVPILLPGAAAAFTLIANVGSNAPLGTFITNVASATSATIDMNQNNNFSIFSTRVISPLPADLSLIKTGPATVSAGGMLTYTITVKNNGPNDARNVVLNDGLQQGTTFVSFSAPPGWVVTTPPAGNTGLVSAAIPLLENGASATFTLVTRAPDNLNNINVINNVASITSANIDPVPPNNSFQTSANVIATSCSLICPANITTFISAGQCGAVVNFPFPTISGNCGSVTATPASGSLFGLGTTTVRINTSAGQTCTFTITVRDTLPPRITSCPVVPAFCGNSSGTYSIPRLVATDNCRTAGIGYTISGATNRSGTGDNASGLFNTGLSTITWTVRDSSNNTTSCQTRVTVNSPITVNIPDTAALNTGVNPNTVYPGYAPASKITLTATVSGGTPPYTYSWSNGATTASVKVSPATTSAYTVTVTDALGCKQVSAGKVIKVVDVRCGNKVKVCSVLPDKFGNSFTSCVYASAVAPLLKAGSRLGSCSTPEDYTLSLKATPNPTHSYFILSITSSNTREKITVNIYDITGKLVESKSVQSNSMVQIGASYRNGVYLAEAVQGTKKATLLILKL